MKNILLSLGITLFTAMLIPVLTVCYANYFGLPLTNNTPMFYGVLVISFICILIGKSVEIILKDM